MVNITTWVGSTNGMPTVSDRVRQLAEATGKAKLAEKGLAAETCRLVDVTPFQGGHIGLTFVAGAAPQTTPWLTKSPAEFRDELRHRPIPREVFSLDGEWHGSR